MIEDGRMVSGVLSDEDLRELKNELISSAFSYDDKNFRHIYGIKDTIEGTVRRLASVSALASLKSLSGNEASNHVNMGYSPDPGIVVYSTDGLEDLKSGDVNADILDEEKHAKQELEDGRLVGAGDLAFKLVTDENWSIVVPADESVKEAIGDDSYVKVRFIENDYESWGKVNFLENEDGLYLELAFTNSMITFAPERSQFRHSKDGILPCPGGIPDGGDQ